ncbi:MAG TPA: flagellar basal body rod C-terminal domain-containing protein [Candidatus Elarobacter sp.]|nr:flagellar basal body rod C-terminal domain-containing protein [Candidatus Elarobacter sp.]
MSEFDLLSVAAGGMNVQRTLLDVAARNVAAAQASTPEHPYPRLVARFAKADPADAFLGVPDDDDDAESDAAASRLVGTVPSGETADALTEMIAVLDAQRAYEANASVFDVGKRLAERTIDVGRV